MISTVNLPGLGSLIYTGVLIIEELKHTGQCRTLRR